MAPFTEAVSPFCLCLLPFPPGPCASFTAFPLPPGPGLLPSFPGAVPAPAFQPAAPALPRSLCPDLGFMLTRPAPLVVPRPGLHADPQCVQSSCQSLGVDLCRVCIHLQ